MDLVTIYEDEKQKVEMPSVMVEKLNSVYNNFFNLEQEQLDEILRDSFTYIRENYPDFLAKEVKCVTSTNVQRLHRNEIFELSTYYILFTDAVILLSQYFDETEGPVTLNWKQSMEQLVLAHYKAEYEETCIVHFFEENYHGVSGFMALSKDDIVIIKLFTLNEDGKTQKFFK